MMNSIAKAMLAITLVYGIESAALEAGGGAIVTADASKHFDPKCKAPSEYTVELQNGLRASPPFADDSGITSGR